LHARGIGYVLGVACDHRAPTRAGVQQVDALAARLPRRAWQRVSAGQGAKGHRFYDWAWVDLHAPDLPGHHWLLVRRSRRTGELAFYRCFSPGPVPLAALVRVAGLRWKIEEAFQTSKGATGLDQHQVRRHTSWYRWTTLVMLAHAFLAVLSATERARTPTPAGLMPLTLTETRRLFITLLIQPAQGIWHRLRWSAWRRRHQHRARISHYQRQAVREP
jgi:SRSO17 transposase